METIWFNWKTNPDYSELLKRGITLKGSVKCRNKMRDLKTLRNREKRKRKNKILRKMRNAN